MHRSKYTIPDGMTHNQVCAGLIEMIRPCSPTITAHFAKLLAFKPMYDVDETRIKIIFETLYEDLKDFPEVAVVIALDDLRKSEGKYWPDTHSILKKVSEYHLLIKDALDYFQQEEPLAMRE